MQTTSIITLVSLLASSAFATPMELNTRDLATCVRLFSLPLRFKQSHWLLNLYRKRAWQQSFTQLASPMEQPTLELQICTSGLRKFLPTFVPSILLFPCFCPLLNLPVCFLGNERLTHRSAGATCSLEGKCAKGAPVSSSGSGSESGGDHKPTHKPSEVMQLAKQLRAAKKMVKQEGGASDESS